MHISLLLISYHLYIIFFLSFVTAYSYHLWVACCCSASLWTKIHRFLCCYFYNSFLHSRKAIISLLKPIVYLSSTTTFPSFGFHPFLRQTTASGTAIVFFYILYFFFLRPLTVLLCLSTFPILVYFFSQMSNLNPLTPLCSQISLSEIYIYSQPFIGT